MDYIFLIFSNTLQYFMTLVFIYLILGRNKKITFYFSFIVVVAYGYPYFKYFELLLFLLGVLIPYILSFFLILLIFKDLPKIKIRSNKFKKKMNQKVIDYFYTNNYNLRLIKILSFVLIIPLILLSIFYFLQIFEIDLFMYVILNLFILIMYGLVIFRYLHLKKYKFEKVVLITGKTKFNYYEFIIENNMFKVSPKDFYQNELYFLTFIAEILVINNNYEKYYVYQIPADNVDLSNELKLKEINNPLSIFENLKLKIYEFKKATYKQEGNKFIKIKQSSK